MRDGPNDFILLRGSAKKLARSLQPDGSYRVTKLGKAFFKNKFTEFMVRPVNLGRRRLGKEARAPRRSLICKGGGLAQEGPSRWPNLGRRILDWYFN